MIPEVQDFLALIRHYIRQHQEAGVFMPVSGDALLEVLLSVVDGMAFVNLIRTDFGYSSHFVSEDVGTIARLLVAGLLVSPLHQSRLYYDAVAADYDELYTDGISLAENALVTDRLAAICKGRRVLDLGCGSGLGYELLAKACGEETTYVGIDISSQMIAAARRRFFATSTAEFHVMDAADLSYFPPRSFDVVISLFGSFSHVIERGKAVNEIRRAPSWWRCFLMLYSRYSIGNLWKNVRHFTLRYFEKMQAYEIRKTSGSILADAWFYDQRSVGDLLQDFEDVDTFGINALLELPLFVPPFEASHRIQRAKRYLRAESRALKRAPGFCHSLVVTARQPLA